MSETQVIHPTAIIEDGAVIGAGVRIGPYCTVGAAVCLGEGVELVSHVALAGRTTIGARTKIYPFASIGHAPQDLKFHGEPSRLVIGCDTTIREHVTINPGTEGGGMETRVGDRCLIMVGAHIAHDCQVGNNVILVNNATLAGHVQIGDHAILGGLCAIHQWVRIGELAFIGGMSGVENDVIPFGSVIGNRGRLGGLNLVGLKRANLPREEIHAIRNAYKDLFSGEGALSERAARLAATYPGSRLVGRLTAFVAAGDNRPLTTPRARDGVADADQ